MKLKTVRGISPAKGGIIVAGGGTAGHLLPGIAVVDKLVERGWPRDAVLFVGSSRGVELEMVPSAGYELTALSGRGLNGRRVSLQNLLNLAGIMWAIFRGIWIVKRRRPSVVLSLGGYAALPAGLGALLFKVPLVLAEQNAAASAANRLPYLPAHRACARLRKAGQSMNSHSHDIFMSLRCTILFVLNCPTIIPPWIMKPNMTYE